MSTAWEQAVGNVAAATRPESVRGDSFLAETSRERLLRMGASALTDSELLSVLLRRGAKGHPVLGLAEQLLITGGGLKALALTDPQELAGRPGLGPGRAAQILAALELGRRVQKGAEQRPKLRTPKDIYAYLSPSLSALRKEVFHVLCFNSRNQLLRDARVAEGGSESCPVDPREVFSPAVSTRASAVVVAHNHPSGDPAPSVTDLRLTQLLVDGGRLLTVRVLDHMIIGDNRYFSFIENGCMPMPHLVSTSQAAEWDAEATLPGR